MDIKETKALLSYERNSRGQKVPYITKVVKPLPSIDIRVVNHPLKEDKNVEYKVNFTDFLPFSQNGTVTNYPRIELEVEGSDDATYNLILEDCQIKISEYGGWGCLYAKRKYLQRLGIVKQVSQEVATYKYQADKSKTLKELRSYIKADTWMWDFDYVEGLIDKMNDRELEIFSETGKLMVVEGVERSDTMPAYY